MSSTESVSYSEVEQSSSGITLSESVGAEDATGTSATASVNPHLAITSAVDVLNPLRKPTYLEVFLGQANDILIGLQQARLITERWIAEFNLVRDQNNGNDRTYSDGLLELQKVRETINAAIAFYRLTPKLVWTYQWSLLILLIMTGAVEVFFIELYARWHGAYFLSFDLYNPLNIDILSKITFVNGPTTMGIAAEVLMWSSLGVWAQQSYANTVAMVQRKFRFVDDGLSYMGNMMRTCSIAAIVVIVLRLSKFSIFGVSLEATSPNSFDATIGLSFLLGFFGNDAYRILTNIKNRILKNFLRPADEAKD